MKLLNRTIAGLAIAFTLVFASTAAAHDPLPSWNEGSSKTAIMAFVVNVTDKTSAGYVPPAERIATFDNDGTLWSEQPIYFQLAFAIDRVKAMAPDHPEWQETEPFKSVLADDMKGVMASGMEGMIKILTVSHSGMTAEEFALSARQWGDTAINPSKGMPYIAMIYQPMLELLDYLRANEFKTFIVSGGGVDFMRVFTEDAYGIPPEQVVGSTPGSHFEMLDGIPTIIKDPKIILIDDKDGKPVGIYRNIGRRPILAGGNSDGDLQMLEYTTIPRDADDKTPRLGLIVHHTDAEREFAYDREGHIGVLNKGLDDAALRGWIIIDMKNEWRQIYPTK